MATQRVLIFGHSHVWAIKSALGSGSYQAENASISYHILLCGTKQFPGPLLCYSHASTTAYVNLALISALSRYPPPAADSDEQTWLVCGVQGNYYNVVGMLDGGEVFDFVLPGYESLPLIQDCCIVPYSALRHAMTEQMKELPIFFKRLSNLGYTGLIHLGSPPPVADGTIIATQLAADPKFNTKPISVTPANVRRKLWLLQESLLRDICQKAGVHYLPAPVEAVSPNGFLQPQFCKDAVHGNTGYATRVLRGVEKLIFDSTAR